MGATKSSIYIPDHVNRIIGAYGRATYSGTITTLVERYTRITADACPELTEAEWSAICDALNGAALLMGSGGMDLAAMVWAEVADAHGLGEKYGVDCRELAAKLQALPLAGRYSVWDVAARFWRIAPGSDSSTRDLIVAAGGRFPASASQDA